MHGFRNERFCPVCGKLFYVARYNQFKIREYYDNRTYKLKNVCSYGCMRKWEKEHD